MTKKFLVLVGLVAGSTAGWYLGGLIGTMTAYFVSLFGAAAGMIFMQKVLKKYVG
ncbi:MAG: hypothetical protein AB1921_17215 [Thermodesulfobacteriota bacterium]